MANNLIQVKRTSVSGRVPNTSNLSNPGELALNMTDGILYSTNGSVVFEIGANNTNVNVSANLTVKTIVANGSPGVNGYILTSNGSATYWSSPGAAAVDQTASFYWTNTHTFTNTVTFNSTINGTANNALYLNNKAEANLNVNSAVFSTNAINANNAAYFNGKVEANLNVNSAVFSTNAINANNALYLGNVAAASYVTNTDSRTLSGNLVFTGNVTTQGPLNTNDIFVSNTLVVNASIQANALIVQSISANGSVGTNGQILTSNGTASYWANPVNTNPGGSNLSIQYNNAGAFTGTSSFTFDPLTNTVSVNTISINTIKAGNTPGTNGQVLTSNGTTSYWSAPPSITVTNYNSFRYTAANNQFAFSGADDNSDVLAYTPGYIVVFVNGIKIIDGDDYSAVTGTSITLTSSTSDGDIVEIVSLETAVLTNDVAVTDSLTLKQNVNITSNTTTTNALTPQVIDRFPVDQYRSAKYTIQITDNTNQNFHLQELILVHNNANVFVSEYAGLYPGGSALGTFDALIVGDEVRLQIVPVTANSTIKVVRTLIKI